MAGSSAITEAKKLGLENRAKTSSYLGLRRRMVIPKDKKIACSRGNYLNRTCPAQTAYFPTGEKPMVDDLLR